MKVAGTIGKWVLIALGVLFCGRLVYNTWLFSQQPEFMDGANPAGPTVAFLWTLEDLTRPLEWFSPRSRGADAISVEDACEHVVHLNILEDIRRTRLSGGVPEGVTDEEIVQKIKSHRAAAVQEMRSKCTSGVMREIGKYPDTFHCIMAAKTWSQYQDCLK